MGVGRVEVDKQVVDLVEDLERPGVMTIDLVDTNYSGQSRFQSLLEHEASLRQGTFTGVDQQQNAVDHRERAFDLAAEVGMARSIDDINSDRAPGNRGIFGQNGDATLALQGKGIEHPLHHLFVSAEDSRLAEQGVHEGGLAVVNVGDNCQVSDIVATHLLLR